MVRWNSSYKSYNYIGFMNHRYKSIFRSHHWLGILGVAAVTIGATGLVAPESSSSIQDPHRNVNVVSPSSGRSTLAAFSAGYEEANRPAIRLPTSATRTQKPAFSFSKASAHASHHESRPNHLIRNDSPSTSPSYPPFPRNVIQIPQGTFVENAERNLGIHANPISAKAGDPAESAQASTKPADRIKTLKISKGDNLTLLFRRLGLPNEDLHRILNHEAAAKTLHNIHPGQTIKVHISPAGRLTALRYEPRTFESLIITLDEHGIKAQHVIDRPKTRIAFAEGIINSSLFDAATKAGLSDKQIMNLADIFAWDVDFGRDIRPGDRFALLYEVLYRQNKQVGTGRILAAEFTNDGRVHRAVHFQHKERGGYYDPQGRPMRKTFLRSPVNFTRISSGFSLRRWHPKLHTFRAHRGVDYAAPTGTAIRAAGDGKIIFAGRKGGYGRTVIIQHGERYSTLYAHLHRIKRGMKPGKRVQQGNIIGTVGRSGLATGPHLHYEFRVDGTHRNPLKVKLPGAPALPKKLMAHFRSQTSGYLTQLAKFTRTNLAARD